MPGLRLASFPTSTRAQCSCSQPVDFTHIFPSCFWSSEFCVGKNWVACSDSSPDQILFPHIHCTKEGDLHNPSKDNATLLFTICFEQCYFFLVINSNVIRFVTLGWSDFFHCLKKHIKSNLFILMNLKKKEKNLIYVWKGLIVF